MSNNFYSWTNPLLRLWMCSAEVRRTVRFFNDSAKRQTFLETAIATVESETKRMKLKELCRTRWVERHDALEIFTDFLPAVVNALETYGEKETRSDALADSSGLLHAITTFQFIMVLMVVFKCLGYIKQLSIVLQGKAMDVVSAMKEVSVITTTLEEVRTDIDMFHDLWYEAAMSLAESVGVEPSMPRICGRQTRRENTQATTASEYYRRNLTVVFLDHLLTEMRTRFGDLQRKAAMGLCLIPAIIVSDDCETDRQSLDWYIEDLTSPSTLEAEIQMWQKKWRSSSSTPPDNIQTALLNYNESLYPNVATVLRIASAFPVTSCECERSISTLGLVKTRLRASMGEERLSSFCLISIHRDIDIDIKAVIGEFARRNVRKLNLPDILNSE